MPYIIKTLIIENCFEHSLHLMRVNIQVNIQFNNFPNSISTTRVASWRMEEGWRGKRPSLIFWIWTAIPSSTTSCEYYILHLMCFWQYYIDRNQIGVLLTNIMSRRLDILCTTVWILTASFCLGLCRGLTDLFVRLWVSEQSAAVVYSKHEKKDHIITED